MIIGYLRTLNLPLVSREWKNGSSSSYNCTPFLHSLLTKGKLRDTPRRRRPNQGHGQDVAICRVRRPAGILPSDFDRLGRRRHVYFCFSQSANVPLGFRN